MALLRTSWLTEPLPQQVLEDSGWMRIVHFFLIESPCPGQSNRKNNEIDKWAPAPWVGIRSLKTSLNQTILIQSEKLKMNMVLRIRTGLHIVKCLKKKTK